MKKFTPSNLAAIFKAAEKTIKEHSGLSQRNFDSSYKHFKNISTRNWNDENYYWVIVYVTFYSGFKAKTVTDKLPSIKKAFPNIITVSEYSARDIDNLIASKKIIGNRRKIEGLVENAKEMLAIRNDFGSFKKYLSSFGSLSNDNSLLALIEDLKARFYFLGGITVYHFLTDIGCDVLKPDRVLCRIFYRLGLVRSETSFWDTVTIGRSIAKATGHPIRYIDIIFVTYGQVGKQGICLSSKPKCNICGIESFCNYN